MKLYQYQINVMRDWEDKFWYTAQKRRVYFLFRGFWKDITPVYQTSYQKALDLTNK